MSAPECSFCGQPLSPCWDEARIWRCVGCCLLLRNPMPTEEELKRLYDASWDRPEDHSAETGGTDLPLARTYVRRLARSLGRWRLDGLRILDFGAGRGDMLAALKERGAEAHAVEPFGCEFLRDRGFAAYRDLDEVPEGTLFDGAVSFDVVEHLRTPWVDIAALRRLLKPGAWLLVCTPNGGGLRARLKGGRWEEARKPGHLVLFTSRSLRSVFARCGFVRCRRLRWFVPYRQRKAGRLVNYLLQGLYLDGALRYLAWNG